MPSQKTLAFCIFLNVVFCIGCGKPDVAPAASNPVFVEASFAEQWNNVLIGTSDQVRIKAKAVTPDEFAKVRPADGLTTLILDSGKVSDNALRDLIGNGKCLNIQHLRLRLSPITDDGMKEIAQLKELRILNLPHSECSAAGIFHLRELENLKQLRLGSKVAGGDVCAAIREILSLSAVHLIDIPVRDDDLMQLAKMPKLHSLYIDGGDITDAGWSRLFKARPALHVHVNDQHHDLDSKAEHEQSNRDLIIH